MTQSVCTEIKVRQTHHGQVWTDIQEAIKAGKDRPFIEQNQNELGGWSKQSFPEISVARTLRACDVNCWRGGRGPEGCG